VTRSGQTAAIAWVAVWIHGKIAGALVGYEPISDRVLVVRLKAKPRNIIIIIIIIIMQRLTRHVSVVKLTNRRRGNITLIQVYGPTTVARDEEMERF